MRLALEEIRRSRGRFTSIVAALSLIVFLVLILSALSDGLYFSSTGALRNAKADAYVFSSEAEGSFVRSRLPESKVASLTEVAGVAATGPVGVLLTPGRGPDGEVDLAIFGVAAGQPGSPERLADGRLPREGENGVGAVDESLRDFGVRLGDILRVRDVPIEVIGITTDSSYQGQGTVWTSLPTWRAARDAVRPEQRGQRDTVTAVALQLQEGTSAAAVAAAAGGDVTVLDIDASINAIPGTEQQRSTLSAIIYTTLLVAGLVVALFFALLTLEKRQLLAALKALGSSTSRLGVTLFVQSVVLTSLGLLVGAALARLAGLVLPADVPALFRNETLATVAVIALVFGVLGAAFSLRRIARIDPATALGGTLV